jgi:DNA polymerase-3 subunit alpha
MNDKKLDTWSYNENLSKEFEAIGFFVSDHPLKYYKDIIDQHKAKSFADFEKNNIKDCILSGTIMSVKEKKTAKGNSFAIIKFSDLTKVFELFLFSEILENNRNNLIAGKSFLITVIKNLGDQDNRFKRINVRKIVNLDDAINLNYTNVHIEINDSLNLEKLYQSINERGDSKIKISINEKNKNYFFELKDKRKFDYKKLKDLNKEHYIKKINV